MKKIVKNKEISILLVLLFCIYFFMFIEGCNTGFMGFTNKKINIGLLAQNFKDKSFGELAKKGAEEAKEKIGIVPKYIEVKDGKENKESITKPLRKLAETSKMTIVMGEEMKSPIEKISRERRDKNFTIFDAKVNESNVKSVNFHHEEGGFLMGVIAGNETKLNKVGYVGGVNDEIGLEFYNGYAAGIKAVNEKAAKLVIDGTNVRFTQSFSDEKKAYEKAIELYDEGCDIIFQTCGNAGMGVFKAAKERGKYAIGVDTDQRSEISEYKNQIISSMIKKVDKAVLNICKEVKEGSFKSGIENMEILGVKDNMIDYAPSTEEAVSKKTMEDLKKYKEKIATKDIKVPTKTFEVIEFKG